jgi:hypothetical protein
VGVLFYATVEDDRASRATAAMMSIERDLECGHLKQARAELHDAIAQLGREAMLLQLENRLERIEQASDPTGAARIDAIVDPFEHSWARWDRSIRPLSLFARVGHRLLLGLPLAICIAYFAIDRYDAMIRSAHATWIDEALHISLGRDSQACIAHLSTYSERLTRLTSVSTIPRPAQVRELRARAALSACSGDFERAVRDQSLAVEIADAHRSEITAGAKPQEPMRIEAELVYCGELRQLAAWHTARRTYRDALRATRRAKDELERAHQEVGAQPPSTERDWAMDALSRESRELESTRLHILERMDVRG